MKFCGKCGANNGNEMSYCNNCGASLMSISDEGVSGYASQRQILETKVVQVNNSPSVINDENKKWAMFGWTAQNVQVTHSQDTRTYTKGFGDLYSGTQTVETTTINYATITYQRDKNMPNYKRLSELEYELDRIEGNLMIMSDDTSDAILNPMLLVVLLLFAFPFGVLYYFNYKSKQSKARETARANISGREYKDLLRRREEIFIEANSLV